MSTETIQLATKDGTTFTAVSSGGDMSLHQPAGWSRVATIRDDTAVHQIRIGKSDCVLYWSCVCQPRQPPYGPPFGLVLCQPPEVIPAAHAAHAAEAGAA